MTNSLESFDFWKMSGLCLGISLSFPSPRGWGRRISRPQGKRGSFNFCLYQTERLSHSKWKLISHHHRQQFLSIGYFSSLFSEKFPLPVFKTSLPQIATSREEWNFIKLFPRSQKIVELFPNDSRGILENVHPSLASLRIRRLIFQFIRCRSFHVRRRPFFCASEHLFLAWVVGVPVGRRSGSQLATTSMATISVILLLFFFFSPSSSFLRRLLFS